ncbi:flagellar basal body P-ring biosynthesis protein [Mycolicibacterium rhodesiae NBB3]|uniref:Flagellar basal body P-ring biosynthesis protein n=1 Tax=Mycolicibacterium rhodesiae (strain NBB3) TaxID=710685 RepID=G8RPY6_MYCRN|nr:SAF domain-containing protein [Mycolicibacterium rhodesiae]AEV73870.1 flagellar basal body P-ring biosynthesis protein [Mycolicibacterium rhodesiae NBB3]
MGESLNPSSWSRVVGRIRPDWSRTVAARRAAAGVLVILAAVAAVRPDPAHDRTDVVVAARDLAPGAELRSEDVRLESRTAATVPDGAQTDLADVVGARLAGPARRGEALTDVRLLGSRLAESAAGADARLVPLHLDDAALLDLIRPGDVVDVLGAGPETGVGADAHPQVVATDAVVVLVSQKPVGAGSGGDRVLLVALPAHDANAVAQATLVQTVTLTFH